MRPPYFRQCGSAVLGFILLLGCVPAVALDIPETRATLRRLTAVRVVIDTNPDAEKDGIAKEQLRTEVESRLRNAGVAVVPSAAESLRVTANPVRLESGLYAYAIVVEIKQPVMLFRDARIFSPCASTWDVGGLRVVTRDRLREVREDVGMWSSSSTPISSRTPGSSFSPRCASWPHASRGEILRRPVPSPT